MNKWFIVLALFCAFTIGSSFQVQALTFDKLPTKQTSNQWSVQIDKAKEGGFSVKPEKGKFHTYSLTINKIGTDVLLSAEVYMYRKVSDSTTKYALFGCPDEKDCNQDRYDRAISLGKQLNDGIPYLFENFLLTERATELEVEIVWTEKENPGRPLKETFVFTQQ